MTKRQVFYSFHYKNDIWKVSQVKNMGVVDGSKTVTANEWEEVKKKGDDAIKRWINVSMKSRTCLVVLVGTETVNRKWVKYEIEQAWNNQMGVVGIYIHNLKDNVGKTSQKGKNPFETFEFNNTSFANIVKCYDPLSSDAYNDIKKISIDGLKKQ